jgi:hypothetical protein
VTEEYKTQTATTVCVFLLGVKMGRIIKVDDKSGRIDRSIYDTLSSDDDRVLIISEKMAYILRVFVFPYVEFETKWGEWISCKLFKVGVIDTDTMELLKERLTEGFMASIITELADAIRYLADRPCCPSGGATASCSAGGTVGSGSDLIQLPVGSSVTQDALEKSYTGEVVPEGFSSVAEWESAKCAAAHATTSAIQAFFATMATQTFAGTVVAFGWLILSVLVVSIPTIVLSGLLTIITSLEGYVLLAVSDYIGDNYDRIVCRLYKSTSIGDALSGFLEITSELISDAAWSIPVKAKVREVLVTVASETIAQKMFNIASAFLPSADCSDCDQNTEKQIKVQNQTSGIWELLENGFYPAVGVTHRYTVTSQPSGGTWRYVNFRAFLTENGNQAFCDIKIISISNGVGDQYGSCFQTGGTTGYTNNLRSTIGTLITGYSGLSITAQTAFDVVFDVVG